MLYPPKKGGVLRRTLNYIWLLSPNISLNKSWVWQIDGATNKKNPYDFSKVLTFKWHTSKFEPNQIISL